MQHSFLRENNIMDWKWNQNVGLKVSSLQNEFFNDLDT
jgi:hypothetical protein